VNVKAPARVRVEASRRPRKGRPSARYRVTAKLSRCRLAVELRHSMLPILRHAGTWAR